MPALDDSKPLRRVEKNECEIRAPVMRAQPRAEPALDNARFALLPLKGVVYFFVHPQLWCLGLGFLCSSILGCILILTCLIFNFSQQQTAFDSLFDSGILAWLVTVLAVLTEWFALFYLFVFVFMLPCIMDRLFRTVFALENVPWNPVQVGCAQECASDCSRCCAIKMICMVSVVVLFPLIFVPIAGPFLFSAGLSFFTSWDILDRYFGHKKVTFGISWAYAKHYRVRFFLFGFVVMLLAMIPVFQVIFMFTNLVAGALWACEIERTCGLEPFRADQDFDSNSVELSAMGQLDDPEMNEEDPQLADYDHESLLKSY